MTTVLISGIGTLLGTRIAQALSECADLRLLGIGATPPPAQVGRTEILVALLDGHQIAELLRAEQVDTVLHLDFRGEEQLFPNREAALQHNVLGSMELLAACATSAVRRVVVLSSTLVYGAAATTPALIAEHNPVVGSKRSDLIRDYAEVDRYAHDVARRHPDLAVVVLRCAGLVGGGAWSPLARYLNQATPPLQAGFNPRMQVLHPEDAARAFVRAALAEVRGAFNLAADAPLKLEQAIRLAGRQPLVLMGPVLAMRAMAERGNMMPSSWPFDRDFLRYSCVADISRARQELGWEPAHRAADALRDLSAGRQAYNERAQSEIALREFLARHHEQ
jgi:UDP-glucose 4-epimerase